MTTFADVANALTAVADTTRDPITIAAAERVNGFVAAGEPTFRALISTMAAVQQASAVDSVESRALVEVWVSFAQSLPDTAWQTPGWVD
jgi:hypothetical protein